MNFTFRRIISSGNFIPEIDGLRFIAIFSVLIYHLTGFIQVKDLNEYTHHFDFSFFNSYISHGHIGVPLFFVISGFILGKPFALHYLMGKRKVILKNYFLRRITRLEPPYILVMTVLFISSVFVLGKLSFAEGLHSYLYSIVYLHGFEYGKSILPLLNTVVWSLEIEIQFYVLAPFLALLFKIKDNVFRRILIISLSVIFIIFDFYESFSFISVISYLEFFLIGFLLADLYVLNSNKTKKSNNVIKVLTALFFMVIWLFDVKDFINISMKILWEILQLGCIFIFYYLVLFKKSTSFLSNSIITNIGGMCYSIYLIHYPIISMIGNSLVKIKISNYEFINVSFYGIVLLASVLLISSVFFLLIERPCMDKHWYKFFLKKQNSINKK